jgi:chorismate dehydratase
LQQIRVGAADFICVRPLIFGLTRRQAPEVELVYSEPGLLADALSRGRLDAALIPSIEYLRGVGGYFLEGPALIAKPSAGSVVLLARKPAESLERVAVSEFCRSPVSAARIVLATTYGATPDLCVVKNTHGDWRDEYDGILLTGDQGLQFLAERPDPDLTLIDIASMWDDLTSLPLVMGLWVYHDEGLTGQLTKTMVLSRNLGLQNLSRLADGIASTTQYESDVIYDYLANCWEYQLTDVAMNGLRALEDYALQFDLIRCGRLPSVPAK